MSVFQISFFIIYTFKIYVINFRINLPVNSISFACLSIFYRFIIVYWKVLNEFRILFEILRLTFDWFQKFILSGDENLENEPQNRFLNKVEAKLSQVFKHLEAMDKVKKKKLEKEDQNCGVWKCVYRVKLGPFLNRIMRILYNRSMVGYANGKSCINTKTIVTMEKSYCAGFIKRISITAAF